MRTPPPGGVLTFEIALRETMRVIMYVDGYNLYHRRLEGTAYRWLNLRALGEVLLPDDQILQVRYFTTPAQARPGGDGKQRDRQLAYLRALRTTAGFSFRNGLFRERKKELRAVYPPPERVWVYKTEEKGSDVNLACYLLLDAVDNAFDRALVVSNDADLRTPIELVQRRFKKDVVVAIPGTPKQIVKSALPANLHVRILKQHLRAAQFPVSISDGNGTVTKPETW